MSATESRMGKFSAACFTRYFTVGVLTAINLLNYMDRFTLAGKSPWRLRMTHDIIYLHMSGFLTSPDVRILILFTYEGWREIQAVNMRKHFTCLTGCHRGNKL